jgi:hypothetical protein
MSRRRRRRRKEPRRRKGQTMNQEPTPNLIHIKRVAPQATKPHQKKPAFSKRKKEAVFRVTKKK